MHLTSLLKTLNSFEDSFSKFEIDYENNSWNPKLFLELAFYPLLMQKIPKNYFNLKSINVKINK